ncbi:MAG: GNAT family N-acetyltransferase [Bacillota bacterium]
MIRIRKATLTDYYDIWQVHASDIEQWVDQAGQVIPEVWSKTSMAERWQLGGPWMSPETCAIHLNALLLAGQTPLVACRGGKVLGEAELFLGDDAAFGGRTLNISVLYVHRAARGRGIGSALMKEVLRRARVFGCHAVTVYNPSPEAEGLYRRFGLEEVFLQSVLVVPTHGTSSRHRLGLTPIPWPSSHQPLKDLLLWAGSYQSSVQCWQQLCWAITPGLYALPLKPVVEGMVLASDSGHNPAYICLRPLGNGEQAQLHIWSRRPDPEMVSTVMPWAKQAGIEHLQIVAGQETCRTLQRTFGGQSHSGHKRLALRLRH